MIIIGTSGYHFPDWTGTFYPKDISKDNWLQYYSERFPAVEINRTYYGLPKKETVQRWVDVTPEKFKFFIKVHQETTHQRQQNGEELTELFELLQPLSSSGKLQGLLAQFPASFHSGEKEIEYLQSLVKYVESTTLFVEFRHFSWDNDNSISLCDRLGFGWVAVDQPRIRGLSLSRPAVIGTTGYVRFHGRNSKTWYDPKAGDRYDWEYSEKELNQWIPRLSAMAERAEKTYLFFNNCHAGQAIKSAMRMKQMLRDQFEVF